MKDKLISVLTKNVKFTIAWVACMLVACAPLSIYFAATNHIVVAVLLMLIYLLISLFLLGAIASAYYIVQDPLATLNKIFSPSKDQINPAFIEEFNMIFSTLLPDPPKGGNDH